MENIPEQILQKAKKATENLLPPKSKANYEKEYKVFTNWKSENGLTVSETVMMAYFQEMSEKYSPNSLWTKYSILKSTLIVNNNIDISGYSRLLSFLKQKSKGYLPKKSKVLTGRQVLTFIKDAPNESFLLHKVVLVMGTFGGLRRDEMVKMTIGDVEDKGSVILVKVPETKTGESKSFAIVKEEQIGALELVRQYAALRPQGLKEPRFFLTYRKNRCTAQPVGKNTLGSVPSTIARYLKLDNPKEYTGHCLRRTSSTLLVEAGATFEMLKMHGKWKSSTVAESYVAESVTTKKQIANMIASSVSTLENRRQDSSFSVSEDCMGCDERTLIDTSVDVGPEESSSVSHKVNKCISIVSEEFRAVTLSGTFTNCHFNFGKDVVSK